MRWTFEIAIIWKTGYSTLTCIQTHSKGAVSGLGMACTAYVLASMPKQGAWIPYLREGCRPSA